MSSLVISGDTSGAITLSAPSVAGTNTITLPAATGTAMVSGNMPAFSAVPNSTQSLSSAVFTKVNFATVQFDTNSNFSSSRFTPTVAGYYQISAGVNISVASTGTAIISLFKNGAEYRRGGQIITAISANLVPCGSYLIYLNGTTDYVEAYAYCSGTGGTITGGTNECCFTGALVRAA